MSIEFKCECGETLVADDQLAGKRGRCPTCHKVVIAPGISGEPPITTEEEQERPIEESPKRVEGHEAEHAHPLLDRFFAGVYRRRIVIGVSVLFVLLIGLSLLARQGPDKPETDQEMQPLESPARTEESPPPPAELPTASGPRDPEPHTPVSPMQEQGEGEPKGAEETSPDSEYADEVVESFPDADETPPESASEQMEDRPDEAPVTTESEPEASPPERTYTVNLATFREKWRAEKYVEDLKQQKIDAFFWDTKGSSENVFYRVSTGRFPSREQAASFSQDLEKRLKSETFVTTLPETR